jgi:gamma-glutamylputrescine oxidase
MKHRIFWRNERYSPAASLRGITHTRYLIVGAGITGLSCAYFLLRKGIRPTDILLLEADTVGGGSTGRSAGMLIPEPENQYSDWWAALTKQYGLANIKAYRREHLRALSTLKRLIKKAPIACDMLPAELLILARNTEAERFVETDARAREELGARVQRLHGARLMNEIASPQFIFGARVAKGIAVNPLALTQGIAGHLRTRGVRIHEHSRVLSMHNNLAKTSRGQVRYEHVIHAQGVGSADARLVRYTSTIAVTRPLGQRNLKKLHLDDKDMFIDEDPGRYCYYGKIAGDRLLLGYGDTATDRRSAKTGLHVAHARALKAYAGKIFPQVRLPFEFAWSGVYCVTHGMIPTIRVGKHATFINGAGDQLGCMVAAEYAITKLTGKAHPLDRLWQQASK